MLAPVSSRPGRTRRRWAWVALALVLAVALELAIRAGEPRTVGPTGVDTLQVPWTDPDPDTFVAGLDHPWLPLEPGDTWTFGEEQVVVAAEPYEVAGIDATVVTVAGVDRFVAEDDDGNVWLLGERGHTAGAPTPDWSVADGSPAGLVLPAEPRRGDGWATVVPDGEVHAATRVLQVPRRGLEAPTDRLVLVLTTGLGGGTGQTRDVEVRLATGRGPVEVVAPGAGLLRRTD